MIRRTVHNWERKLAQRDTRRAFAEFDWGVPFLRYLAETNRVHLDHPGGSNGSASLDVSELEAKQLAFEINRRAIADSDAFFEARPVSSYSLEGRWLSFESPIQTPYPENNTAYAQYFPAPAPNLENGHAGHEVERARGRAILVLPQWNADVDGHIALCQLLNRLGMAALRISLPYHDRRLPVGHQRADYLVSANVGRTLQGCLQAVVDCRAAIDWLAQRGYDRIGILGTSIGSCIGFLTMVHDPRLKVAVFNHVSSYFGDVVWEGLTTAHVRHGLEQALDGGEVRRVWAAISPNSYVPRLTADGRRRLMISARYDLSFTPELSELLFDACRRHDVDFDTRLMPCGHYSLGEAPFKYLAAYHIATYFRRFL